MEIDRENFDDSLLSGLLWFPEIVINMDSWYFECERVLELYGIICVWSWSLSLDVRIQLLNGDGLRSVYYNRLSCRAWTNCKHVCLFWRCLVRACFWIGLRCYLVEFSDGVCRERERTCSCVFLYSGKPIHEVSLYDLIVFQMPANHCLIYFV